MKTPFGLFPVITFDKGFFVILGRERTDLTEMRSDEEAFNKKVG